MTIVNKYSNDVVQQVEKGDGQYIIDGYAYITKDLNIDGDVNIAGGLDIDGDLRIVGDLDCDINITGTLEVSETLNVIGDFTHKRAKSSVSYLGATLGAYKYDYTDPHYIDYAHSGFSFVDVGSSHSILIPIGSLPGDAILTGIGVISGTGGDTDGEVTVTLRKHVYSFNNVYTGATLATVIGLGTITSCLYTESFTEEVFNLDTEGYFISINVDNKTTGLNIRVYNIILYYETDRPGDYT